MAVVAAAGAIIAATSRVARFSVYTPPPVSSDRSRGVGVWFAKTENRLTRRKPSASRWPIALRMMAREVRSGTALSGAIEVAAVEEPSLTALGRLAERRRIGASDHETAGETHGDDADERLAMGTLRHLIDHGGQLAGSLDRAAATIHERDVVRSERAVQAAQARISARVLSIIAPLFAGWSAVGDPRVRGFLLGTLPGFVCLSTGVALNVAGYGWMRRVVGRP